MKHIHQVIKQVRLSEKASLLQESHNVVTLEVDRKANKIEIKQAVEQLLGKKVIGVRTANYDGKARRKRRADQGRTSSWKKAMVVLKEGQSLDLV
jgi:large subunit ribosomal protein L23